MCQMFRLLHMDFKHCLFRWKNLTLLASCMFLLYASISEKIQALWKYGIIEGGNGAIEILFELLYFDRFKGVLITLLATICSYVISDEISTGFCDHVFVREVGIQRYMASKLLVNAISVVCFCILSFTLFVISLSHFFPMSGHKDYIFVGYYSDIYKADTYWLVAVLAGLQFGLAGLFLIQIGIMVSVLLPRKVISIAIPYIIYSFLYTLHGDTLNIPGWLDYFLLSSCWEVLPVHSFLPNFVCSNLMLLTSVLLTGFVCIWLAQRRHANGYF